MVVSEHDGAAITSVNALAFQSVSATSATGDYGLYGVFANDKQELLLFQVTNEVGSSLFIFSIIDYKEDFQTLALTNSNLAFTANDNVVVTFATNSEPYTYKYIAKLRMDEEELELGYWPQSTADRAFVLTSDSKTIWILSNHELTSATTVKWTLTLFLIEIDSSSNWLSTPWSFA